MSGGRSGRGGVRTQGDMEGTGPRLDGGGAVLRDSGGGASQKWGGREGGGPQRSAGDDGKGRGGRLESNSGDDREKIGTQAQTKFSKEKVCMHMHMYLHMHMHMYVFAHAHVRTCIVREVVLGRTVQVATLGGGYLGTHNQAVTPEKHMSEVCTVYSMYTDIT